MRETDVFTMLDCLRGRYPEFELWVGHLPPGRWVWFARGRERNPWLIMSADLERFRHWLNRDSASPAAP